MDLFLELMAIDFNNIEILYPFASTHLALSEAHSMLIQAPNVEKS